MRYERKFAIESLDSDQVLGLIRIHPARFREVYPPRFVNNIYLDSVDLESYHDNVNGVMTRVKHRVRWYGRAQGLVEEPRYEIKLKKGFVGEKRTFKLEPLALDGDLTARDLLDLVARGVNGHRLREELRRLRPAMFNRYRRLYFLSRDGKYRITVDHRMSYGRFPPRHRAYFGEMNGGKTVVELKYDVADDAGAQLITSAFPFRLTKNSKYVTGVHSALCTAF